MWISVDKRLPKADGAKLVTVQDMHGKRGVTKAHWHKSTWRGCGLTGTVIAWANLPRAYRGDKKSTSDE